ncbi:sugar phosphate nucleotidyltransferase [Nitrospina watsonii]|uniref:Nucleotidyl transferase n=1 Tax=Nitrospina watsonii TaxID=1323948 RepID=A0ABM9HCS1_9BACT|nr:NTP transferase domain-containing protein [Nitrospina watsonii]CAI2717862.1 Nucleotidyl transferase [Nitrospina watsonii]
MQGQGLAVIILAAGQGKRMQSDLPKVLHPLAGRPLLVHVLDGVQALAPERILIVVGYQADRVRPVCAGYPVEFVEQTEQLGTGHAVMQAEAALQDFTGDVLILCGDMPLIRPETLRPLLLSHRASQAPCTLLSLKSNEKKDFGRVIRQADGSVGRIVENKDASPEEKTVDEYNSGVYCFEKSILFKALKGIGHRNAQQEYYLTDTVSRITEGGQAIQAIQTGDASEIFGINSIEDLNTAEQLFSERASNS